MPDVKTTKECIKLCFYADIPVYLWGATASAKTALVKQVASEELKIPIVSLYFQTQEPGDILGLPHVQILYPDGNIEDLGTQTMNAPNVKAARKGKKVTSWAAPEWFQFILENPKEGIIFGDEANRAQPDTAQTFTCLITERRFHVHEVPAGWKFVFASNYGSEYDVRELDEAIMARFCHIKVQPTVTEWLEWGKRENATQFGPVHSRILEFISSSPSHLVQKEDSKSWTPVPKRRGWEWVSNALYAYDAFGNRLNPKLKEITLKTVISGLVGANVYSPIFSEGLFDVISVLKKPSTFDIKDANRFSREIVPVLINTKCTPKLYENLKDLILHRFSERKDLCFALAKNILRCKEGCCETWSNKLRNDKDVKNFYHTIRKEVDGEETDKDNS